MKKNSGISLLRIILAIWIYFFHFYIRWPFSLPTFAKSIILQAPVSMTIFFMLSGYLLEYNRKYKQSYSDFIKKQIFKFYPIYFALCVFSIFVYGYGKNVYEIIINIFVNILLLQSWFSGLFKYSHNGGSWFLSTLLFLYIIYPFLHRLALWINNRKINSFAIFAIFYILSFFPSLIFFITNSDSNYLYINPFFRIPEFFLGIYVASTNKESITKKLIPLLTITLLSLTIYLLINLHLPNASYTTYNFIVVPFGLMLILFFTKYKIRINEFLISVINIFYPCLFAFYLFQGLFLDGIKNITFLTAESLSHAKLFFPLSFIIYIFLCLGYIQIQSYLYKVIVNNNDSTKK